MVEVVDDDTLLSVVASIKSHDDSATIFAVEPWECRSAAKLVHDEVDSTQAREGYGYFLEVSVAREILEGSGGMSLQARCERLIQYAINDC